jgi:hypothetical protein
VQSRAGDRGSGVPSAVDHPLPEREVSSQIQCSSVLERPVALMWPLTLASASAPGCSDVVGAGSYYSDQSRVRESGDPGAADTPRRKGGTTRWSLYHAIPVSFPLRFPMGGYFTRRSLTAT